MSKVKLLDCTLRDGGYINNWNFGHKKIKNILKKLNSSNIDIIECGFITGKPYDKDYSLYENSYDVNKLIKKTNKNTMYVGMIAIGEKEIDPVLLCDKSQTYIDGIRLTFHEDEIEKATKYGEIIKEKGYKLFMQPVGTTLYTDKMLINLIEVINELEPYAFYLVDTLGTLYPNDVSRFMYLIDKNLKKDIALGFHSHNNLQLSFSNAQKMLDFDTDRQLIIDCSVFGMGRGAGNLCTEMICDYLNKKSNCNYRISPILELINEDLMSIFVDSPWGYSASYFLSATNYCHPNYSSYLMAKQTLSLQNIGELLQIIPDCNRGRFNKGLMEEIYQKYQENFIDDSKIIEKLSNILKDKEVLILGSGKSIITDNRRIRKYIKDKNPIVISINFLPKNIKPDYVFISNIKRYEKYAKTIDSSKLIVTSNIKNYGEVWLVNYSNLLNSSDFVSDNSGLMLIKLLINISAKNIILAGMDGFNKNLANNYIDDELIGTIDSYQIEIKNEKMTEEIEKLSKFIDIKFLTPSKYEKRGNK